MNTKLVLLPAAAAIALCAALVLTGCKPSGRDAAGPASSIAVQGEPIQKLTSTGTNPGPASAVEPGSRSAAAIADGDSMNPAGSSSATIASNQNLVVAEGSPAVAAPEIIRSDDRDYLSVGFSQLASYTFEVTDDLLESKGDPAEMAARSDSMIPDNVKKLDKQTVAVKGYMLPLKVEQGKVTEFLLMRDQSMCCFGTVPKINEWVSVKTLGSGVKPIMDQPVTIFGTLHVGEIRENGYLVGIYKMDGEKLAGPLDL